MLARAKFARVIRNIAANEDESVGVAGGSGEGTNVANVMLVEYQF